MTKQSKNITLMICQYMERNPGITKKDNEFIKAALSLDISILWETKLVRGSVALDKQTSESLIETLFLGRKIEDNLYNDIFDNYTNFLLENKSINHKKESPWYVNTNLTSNKFNLIPMMGWGIVTSNISLIDHMIDMNQGTKEQWESLSRNSVILKFSLSTRWKKLEKSLNKKPIKNENFLNTIQHLNSYRNQNIWMKAKNKAELDTFKNIQITPEQGISFWKKISHKQNISNGLIYKFEFLLTHKESWEKWNEDQWQKFWEMFDSKNKKQTNNNFFFSVIENLHKTKISLFLQFLKTASLKTSNTEEVFLKNIIRLFNRERQKRNADPLRINPINNIFKKCFLSSINYKDKNSFSLAFIIESINRKNSEYEGCSKTFITDIAKLFPDKEYDSKFFENKIEPKNNKSTVTIILDFLQKKYPEKISEIKSTYCLYMLNKHKKDKELTQKIFNDILKESYADNKKNIHTDALVLEQLFEPRTFNINMLNNKQNLDIYYNFFWQTLSNNNDVFQRKWLKRLKNSATPGYDFSIPLDRDSKESINSIVATYKKARGKRIKEDKVYPMFQKVLLQATTQGALVEKIQNEVHKPRRRKM